MVSRKRSPYDGKQRVTNPSRVSCAAPVMRREAHIRWPQIVSLCTMWSKPVNRLNGWIRRLRLLNPNTLRKESTQRLIHIVAITKNDDDREILSDIAPAGHWNLVVVDSLETGIEVLLRQPIHVAICDRDLPGTDWRELLQTISDTGDAVSTLLASRVCDDYLWQEVIRYHGYDVITKPFEPAKTVRTVALAAWWSDRRRDTNNLGVDPRRRAATRPLSQRSAH